MPKRPNDALAFTEKFLTRFHDDPLIVPAVAPHAIYTNSDETLQACRALANKHNAPLVIHLSETKHENDECLAKRNMTPNQGARRARRLQRPHRCRALPYGWTRPISRS